MKKSGTTVYLQHQKLLKTCPCGVASAWLSRESDTLKAPGSIPGKNLLFYTHNRDRQKLYERVSFTSV